MSNPVATLIAEIDQLNGIEYYTPSLVPDQVLTGNRRFALPENINRDYEILQGKDVGMRAAMHAREILEIAASNYDLLKSGPVPHPNPIEVAWLRAIIYSHGILHERKPREVDGGLYTPYVKRAEIVIVKQPKVGTLSDKNELQSIADGYKPLTDFLTPAKRDEIAKMARLLPVFAAIQFQKTNHHYIANDEVKEMYARQFKSALVPELAATYNKAEIIYDSVHWMGPYNMEVYKENTSKDIRGLIPRGIKIKVHPTPAGTALITTQIAVFNAIRAFPGTENLIKEYAEQIRRLNELQDEINGDRLAFHVFSELFDKKCRLEEKGVIETMAIAANLAAISQAFIEAVAKDSDLGRAKALEKHAKANIGLFKMATAAFKGAYRRVQRDAVRTNLSDAILGAAAKQAVVPLAIEETPEVI